jgi:hypothetical protein
MEVLIRKMRPFEEFPTVALFFSLHTNEEGPGGLFSKATLSSLDRHRRESLAWHDTLLQPASTPELQVALTAA